MAAKRPTKTGTPRLSDLARHVVVPDGVTSTGWPAVREKCADLGISFDPWQDGAGKIILAKRESGLYAAAVGGVVISIPRQVGKTFLLGAIIFALCLLNPNLTVIWTAHRLRTASETFSSMQGMARRKQIKAHVAKVVLGSGEEEIRFRNGSRILFGARERGFGRGFSEVDVLVFDEAQILTENAIDDMVPATNQAANPLLLFTGTPPKPTDPGEVFRRKRAEALSGEDSDTAYIEFSADPDGDPSDWKQVAKANPSYPKRTPREAILRMRKNLSPESYLREGMGKWDELDASPSIFGKGRWESCAGEPLEMPEQPAAIGVAVSVDRTWASIAAASTVEVLEDPSDPEAEPVDRLFVAAVDRREDVDWLVAEVARIQKATDCTVVIDEKGPTKDLLKDLEDADVAVEPVSLDEYAEACSRFFDKVRAASLLHPSSAELDDAVSGAVWRTVGDRQVWGRRKSTKDVSMLEAATLAAHGAEKFGAFNIY